MTDEIHIYVYYNLISEQNWSNINDALLKLNTKEIAIITNKKIVKEILNNQNNIINEIGEFTDYDTYQFEKIVWNDIKNYSEWTKSDFTPNKIESFYYIKCEFVKNISEQIKNFIQND